MPFQRPTLTALIERILADLSSRMIGSDGAVLRRSVLGVLGRAEAGASHELHGHLDWIANQIIIDTAEAEYLERWANVWGIRRKAAEFAIGSVTFTGFHGAVIPSGTLLQRQDGLQVATTAESTIPAGGTVAAAVQAQTAGATGNTTAGVQLSLVQPIAGVQNSATVSAGGLTNGSDTEDDDGLRARLLSRIQAPPSGGSATDYVQWALEVPGVTRAWCSPQEMGAGTVTVRFVRDDDGSIIPDAAEIDAVRAHIEDLRPVTAELFVAAPTAKPLDMTIALNPNTAAVQSAVLAEITDLLRRESEPRGTILLSHLREAVSIAPGEIDHNIILPAADFDCDTGEIAVLGDITFAAL